ncbi:MAG: hypothetical protein ING08_16010 [Roseomonas sp.]|nr:hypothetical protein [Roseomonas sp.]MCA3381737.1 hypothetical protein [Roseomonas sp.]
MTRNATSFPAGNGAGWGGPANGPGKGEGWGGPAGGKRAQFAQGAKGRPAGIRNGEGKAARARAAFEDAAPEAAETVIRIAQDKADPRALQAALAVLNRIGLHEKAGVEHSGAVAGFVIAAPPEAEDAAAWVRAYAPSPPPGED